MEQYVLDDYASYELTKKSSREDRT